MKTFKPLLLAAVMAGSYPGAGMAQETFFKLDRPVQRTGAGEELEARYSIRLNTKALKDGEPVELLLTLPERTVLAKLSPQQAENLALDKDQSAWRGVVTDAAGKGKNFPNGDIFLMRIGGYIQARIVLGNKVYSLRASDNGQGILERFDARLLKDHPDGVRPPQRPASPKEGFLSPDRQGDSSCEDTAERIDIMVVYTSDAREAASTLLGAPAASTAAIENEIAFALGEANLALDNSAAFHRYNLVRVDEVNYNEALNGGSSVDLLDELRITNDMVMDDVHGWRDASKADLVSLVTSGGQCGWGYTVDTADADTTDHLGFSVVNRSCLNGNISLAHETGHNMGGRHNIENSSASLLSPAFNYGHFVTTPSDSSQAPWRTVMSYNADACENDAVGGICGRITQFSDPDIDFPTGGDPTGVVNAKDNVRVFAQNDSDVAKYRCAKNVVNLPDVWGKDTWADTGLEPDPATAGVSMWRSPYIWVRNSEDITDEHHHQHEDPSMAEDPHVYVKLHNDGSMSQSGDLELYYANASTNLNDPSNWNLIDAQAQTMTTGVSVFEFPWSSLPGTGHYCLLARWNSAGSALSFSNIDTVVRNNKGTIWRNVNITNIGADSGDEQVLTLRGSELSTKTWLQINTRPFTQRDLPWRKVLRATLTIDPRILPGRPGLLGLRQIGRGKFEVPLDENRKLVGPLYLQDEEISLASLRIDVLGYSPDELRKKYGDSQRYSISVQQLLPSGLKQPSSDKPQPFPAESVLGGVDYVIGLAQK